MELLLLAIAFACAFGAGALGSAAVILINDKKMAAVEKVKRRILHGPEKALFAVDVGNIDKSQWAAMMRSVYDASQIIKMQKETTATEIMMKQKEAEARIRAISVSPIPYRVMKDIMDIPQKEFEEWRRERK